MKAQRQLSEKGRDMARQIGAAVKKLGIPVDEIYTSRLNRRLKPQIAVRQRRETRRCIDGQRRRKRCCDGEPAGGNAKAGLALRELVMPHRKPARTLSS